MNEKRSRSGDGLSKESPSVVISTAVMSDIAPTSPQAALCDESVEQLEFLFYRFVHSGIARDREHHNQILPKCFSGEAMTKWLLEKNIAESESDAVYIGERMLDACLLHEIHYQSHFSNSPGTFYRFWYDDPGLYNGPPVSDLTSDSYVCAELMKLGKHAAIETLMVFDTARQKIYLFRSVHDNYPIRVIDVKAAQCKCVKDPNQSRDMHSFTLIPQDLLPLTFAVDSFDALDLWIEELVAGGVTLLDSDIAITLSKPLSLCSVDDNSDIDIASPPSFSPPAPPSSSPPAPPSSSPPSCPSWPMTIPPPPPPVEDISHPVQNIPHPVQNISHPVQNIPHRPRAHTSNDYPQMPSSPPPPPPVPAQHSRNKPDHNSHPHPDCKPIPAVDLTQHTGQPQQPEVFVERSKAVVRVKLGARIRDTSVSNSTPSAPLSVTGASTTAVEIGLDTVMENPVFREQFRSFMDASFCTESLNFMEAVDAYSLLKDVTARQDEAQKILSEFVLESSPQTVNIDGKTRKEVIGDIINQNFHPKVFDYCRSVVFNLAEKDVFQRFKRSPIFIPMVRKYYEDQVILGQFKGQGWVNEDMYRSLHVLCLKVVNLPNTLHDREIYCCLQLDSRNMKTNSIRCSDLAIWDEHFEFPLLPTTSMLEIRVMAKQHFTSHEFLGKIVILIEQLTHPFTPQWYKLLPKTQNEQAHGSIEVDVSLTKNWCSYLPKVDKPPQANVMNAIRHQVSHQKVRFKQDGFDLDLTYITPRIIALAFPAERLQGVYRNKMADVQRFFESRHANSYAVYNVHTQEYEASKFHGRVYRFPFEDHQAPFFEQIVEFCSHMHEWLQKHPQNVAAVHCQTGKGRTGVMIACYLLYSKACSNADEAMRLFANKRTLDGRGITVPSHVRYVRYFQRYVQNPTAVGIAAKTLYLTHVKVNCIPNTVRSSNVDFWFNTRCKQRKNSSKRYKLGGKPARSYATDYITFALGNTYSLRDDVRMEFFHSSLVRKTKMFQFWFNTRFVVDNHLVLSKKDIDGACKDTKNKLYDTMFSIELQFLDQT